MSQELGQNLQVKLLSWPTPQEYNEAVQNVALTFGDADLKAGKPELNALGIPRPITGAFASVYRIQCWDDDWAVRCFLHNVPDQQERYARIEDELDRQKLPYMVGFDYQEQGVLLHGQWYPILKMEWADGETLNQFIDRNVENSSVMRDLVERWKALTVALRQAGIAHGDLQHGNVLVFQDRFQLVDYDGMYVPALAGRTSNELGHRNYQHPNRDKEHFGPYLDNFAAWVIYTSLLALSIDPKLWKQLGGGDECLLFRQSDFVDPLSSPAFALLENHQSPEIRKTARLLRSFLRIPVDAVPELDSNPPQPIHMETLSAPLPNWLNSAQGILDESVTFAVEQPDLSSNEQITSWQEFVNGVHKANDAIESLATSPGQHVLGWIHRVIDYFSSGRWLARFLIAILICLLLTVLEYLCKYR